jgi:predicted membrane chloride channel (bestrophin family)
MVLLDPGSVNANPYKSADADEDPDDSWGPNAMPTAERVCVPGGVKLTRKNELKLFCTLKGTSFEAIVSSWLIGIHLIFYAVLALLFALFRSDEVTVAQCSIDGSIISALTFITTFALSTYLGTTLGRYHERFNNCCQTNGHMTLVSLIAGAELPGERARVATLMRWTNLMMHMYYMLVNGPLSESKWQLLRERGLITPTEEQALQPLKKKPSAVYVWACRIIQDLYSEGKLSAFHAKRMEEHVSGCRGLAAKQIASQLTPIPLCFYHLMFLIVNVYIILMGWNSAVRMVFDALPGGLSLGEGFTTDWDHKTHDLFWAITTEFFGFLIVVIFYNVMLSIAERMSNPYGNDASDYHLDFDLKSLWEESQETIKNMGSGTGPDLAQKMIAHATKGDSREVI